MSGSVDPGTEVVDARGLRCPRPVIELARRARQAPTGTVLEVWATDPAAATDIPAWCRMRGHEFLGAQPHEAGQAARAGHAAYRVRLVAPPQTPPAQGGAPPR